MTNKIIWLIDDDQLVNRINSITVKKVFPDVELSVFSSAQLALETLTANPPMPDYIFLDINMPEVNGFEFLKQVTAQSYDLNIIMLSSSIDPNDQQKAEAYSVVKSYVCKPLLKSKLMNLELNI